MTREQTWKFLDALENPSAPDFEPFYIESRNGSIKDGDTVIIFHFREDKTIQVADSLIKHGKLKVLPLVLMHSSQSQIPTMIPAVKYPNSLGSWISQKGFKQLRVAEIHKRPHVTTYFSGGILQERYPGEDRVTDFESISETVAHLYPEMNASLVANAAITGIKSEMYKLIVVNFANVDVTGHTGNVTATKLALEYVDVMIGQIWNACKDANHVLFIVADHGNGEEDTMLDGSPQLWHTVNNVPFIAVTNDFHITKFPVGQVPFIGNVAASILTVLGLDIPKEMEPSVLAPNTRRGGLRFVPLVGYGLAVGTAIVSVLICGVRPKPRPYVIPDDQDALL
jgi:2,3-bisphosphoglycerate-independent phosphoglycerate mutase